MNIKHSLLSVVVLIISSVEMVAQSPFDVDLQSAVNDAKRLPQEQAFQTRYFSIYSVPKEDQPSQLKALTFWLNSLSREADLIKPRRVSDTVYAIEMDLIGWQAETWEKLLDAEPYWHAKVKVQQGADYQFWWRGGDYGTGQKLERGRYSQKANKEQVVTVSAPWVDPSLSLELSTATNSAVPLVRADWWINQVGDQTKQIVPYYEWLGIKSLKDAQTLAGFDLKLAQNARKEVAAIVAESGVGLNNRQIFRFGTVAGAWWETRDPVQSTDTKNAIRLLDGDFKFDAMEIYFTLPNGLWGFVLADDKGNLQNSAPDTIAADKNTTNNDHRVRNGISCVRCHTEGLRPIDDWSRKVFRGGVGLGSPDREKAKRLRQLYLGPLFKELARDRERYNESLAALLGLKSDEVSKLVADSWKRYESSSMLPDQLAAEIGCTEKELTDSVSSYLKSTGQIDLLLSSIVADPPVPIRREHFEEILPILMTQVKAAKSP